MRKRRETKSMKRHALLMSVSVVFAACGGKSKSDPGKNKAGETARSTDGGNQAAPLPTPVPTPDFTTPWKYSLLQNKSGCFEGLSDFSFSLAPGFNLRNAALVMSTSTHDSAYRTPVISEELTKLGFTRFFEIDKDNKGINGFIASNDKLVYVHYRGTNDVQGFLADAAFNTKKADKLELEGWIHTGFHDAYMGIKDVIEPEIAAQAQGNKPIVFSGFSYGAALTAITATRAALKGLNVHSVYASGQPRFADHTLGPQVDRLLAQRYFRLAFRTDVVPHIPPHPKAARDFSHSFPILNTLPPATEAWASALHYQHAGALKFLAAEGALKEDITDDGEHDATFWNDVRTAKEGFVLDRVLKNSQVLLNHDAAKYVCQLAKLIK